MLRVVKLFWEKKLKQNQWLVWGFLFVCLLGRCAKERNRAIRFLVLAGNRNRIG